MCDRVCMCDHVCVCVICGRIGLCGTVLLRHDVEVRDRQSLFPFSLSFSSSGSLRCCLICAPDSSTMDCGTCTSSLAVSILLALPRLGTISQRFFFCEAQRALHRTPRPPTLLLSSYPQRKIAPPVRNQKFDSSLTARDRPGRRYHKRPWPWEKGEWRRDLFLKEQINKAIKKNTRPTLIL